MSKIAKTNIICDNKQYIAGRVYSDQDVAHLDQNDFDNVQDVVDDATPAEDNLPVEKSEVVKDKKAKKTKK